MVPAGFLGGDHTQVLAAAVQLVAVEEDHRFAGFWLHDKTMQVAKPVLAIDLGVAHGVARLAVALAPEAPLELGVQREVGVIDNGGFALGQ